MAVELASRYVSDFTRSVTTDGVLYMGTLSFGHRGCPVLLETGVGLTSHIPRELPESRWIAHEFVKPRFLADGLLLPQSDSAH